MILKKFHYKTFLSGKLKLGTFPCQLAFCMENRAEGSGKSLPKFIIFCCCEAV